MLLSLIFPILALAADDKILVTATRGPSREADLPFSVSTVDGARWDASGGQAENALATVPGLSVTSSGGPGQPRSVFLRGAKSEHTLVLIDGVPVNDPLSPSRAFDFGQIPVEEIERVEVIKGPQSVLYGSDAMGGVVQIFTKRDRGARARLEGGSYGTMQARVAAMGFRAGVAQSKGFSAADEREGNGEPDGYKRWNLGGSRDFAVGDSLLMRLDAQYQENRVDTDRNGGAHGDSLNTSARHSQFLLREENTVLFGEADGELVVAGSYANHDRDDNTNGSDFYKADTWKGELVHRRPLGERNFLTAGADYGEETGRSSQTTGGARKFRAGGAYLQNQLRLGSWQATAGARHDLHSEHAGATTARVGLGWWAVPESLRLKTSAATGFKAPSLYQTYSIYGSPNLSPERSTAVDLGAELSGETWRTELTGFGNDYRELIDFNLVTSRYFNQKRARTAGVEWSFERSFGRFRVSNAYTFLRAWDPDTHADLLHRPLHSDTLELGTGEAKRWAAGLRLRYVGQREDSHPVLLTRQRMPAFLTLGLDGSQRLSEGLRLVLRGENLLDRRYQETSGFGVPALSGYAGLEAEL